MKIKILGTGTSTGVPQIGCDCPVCSSSDSRDKRLRCSCYVSVGGKNILIDCSPDFRQQMLGMEKFEKIDAIFITHEHYDHVGGLDDLRPYSVFGDVCVYAEEYCANHLLERIPYCFIPKEKRYPGVPAIELLHIEPHVSVRVGSDVEVLPIRVMHGKLPIVGFRIQDFAYITDMKTIPDTEYKYLEGVKLLVVNGLRHTPHPSHQSIEEAIDFSRKIGAERTYFIHMSHHIKPHAEENTLLPSSFELAYDGMELEL